MRVSTLLVIIILLGGCGNKQQEEKSFEEEAAGFIDEPIEFEHHAKSGLPKMVSLTVADSTYHENSCPWVESGSKKVSIHKAEKAGFLPCENCMAGEN